MRFCRAALPVLTCLTIAATLYAAPSGTEAADAPATATWAPRPDAIAGADPAGPRANRLSWRERRKLGLTVSNVRRIVLDLQKAGQIDPDDTAGTSVAVLNVLLEENQAEFEKLPPQFDWDKLLEAIERIIELVMRIISLFAQSTPAQLDVLAVDAAPQVAPVAIHGPPMAMAA